MPIEVGSGEFKIAVSQLEIDGFLGFSVCQVSFCAERSRIHSDRNVTTGAVNNLLPPRSLPVEVFRGVLKYT